MADYHFLPAAAVEFRAGLKWYAERSRQAARRFERAVGHLLANIAANPFGYPECEAGCRQAILTRFPYSVIYRIESDDSVLVAAIAHSSREPGYWLRRVAEDDSEST